MLKKSITKASKQHWPLILLCAVMLAVGLPLICTVLSYQLNPDATSYFSIAEKYARGDFREAVNGYWGPMLSLLLVPFVWAGANMIIAGKTLALLVAIGIVITCHAYLRRLRMPQLLVVLATIALAPTLLLWSVTEPITPDLLFALLALWLVIALDVFLQKPSRKLGGVIGVLGASLYFTKGIGFYVFLAMMAFVALRSWWTKRPPIKEAVRPFIPTIIVFGCLILPFVAAISYKYQKLTINTGASYNYAVVGPDMQWHHALMTSSYAPANTTAYSAWEDPTNIAPTLPKWRLFDDNNVSYFASNILTKNLLTLHDELYVVGPLIAVGMLMALLFAFGKAKWRTQAQLFTALGIVLIGGYSLLALEARYVRAFELCGVLAIALFTATLYDKKIITRMQLVLGGALVAIIAATHFAQTTTQLADVDKKTQDGAMALQTFIPKGSRIIADEFTPSLNACYHLKLQCYGIMKFPEASEQDAYAAQLRAAGTIYFVSYKPESKTDTKLQSFLDTHFKKLTSNSFETLYRLTDE